MSNKKIIVICLLTLFSNAQVFAQTQNNQLSADDQMLLNLLKKSATSAPHPVPKFNNKDIYMLTPSPDISPVNQIDSSSQRCTYNNQPYVLGDIVKTEQGWIKCSPSYFFSSDSPTTAQAGNAVWTKVE